MNRIETIKTLRMMQRDYSHIRKNDNEFEAICMAIEALENSPLTIDEMKEMNGDYVWINPVERYGIIEIKNNKVLFHLETKYVGEVDKWIDEFGENCFYLSKGEYGQYE